MTHETTPSLASILGPSKPYIAGEVAARTVTLEHFNAPAKTLRAGDYAQYFVNVSFRQERWSLMKLESLKARHDRAKKAAHALIAEACTGLESEIRDRIAPVFDDWAAKHTAESLAAMRAYEGMASAMVTGPSNFPVRRQEKLNNAADRRDDRLEEMTQGVMKRMKRVAFPHGAPGEAIRSNNPEAVQLLEEKIAELEAEGDRMKAVNAAWRKAGRPGIADADKWQDFSRMALELDLTPVLVEGIRRGCEGHYLAQHRACPPYEAFQLTNLRARIKQAETRLVELKRMAATPATEPAELETTEGMVERIENTEAARIQLAFPGKPAAETRAILKRNGFRWAPSQGAWQRHLNTAGREAAARVLEAIGT